MVWFLLPISTQCRTSSLCYSFEFHNDIIYHISVKLCHYVFVVDKISISININVFLIHIILQRRIYLRSFFIYSRLSETILVLP
jgi:hypothetical protein